jgi:L-iditol 2-dehydrogenase
MGKQNTCLNKKVPGLGDRLGTFTPYFLSKPSITYRLGPKTGLDVGVLAEPLAVGIHSVFEQAKVEPGTRVLILGGGTIGIVTALAVRMAGAEAIVITDLFDFNLNITSDLCGARTYHVKEEGLEERIRKNILKFITFLCSGALPRSNRHFPDLPRGRIIVTGMFSSSVP